MFRNFWNIRSIRDTHSPRARMVADNFNGVPLIPQPHDFLSFVCLILRVMRINEARACLLLMSDGIGKDGPQKRSAYSETHYSPNLHFVHYFCSIIFWKYVLNYQLEIHIYIQYNTKSCQNNFPKHGHDQLLATNAVKRHGDFLFSCYFQKLFYFRKSKRRSS